ncbi:MAG TPA: hypothetical protein VLA36_06065 [Longimicrobiales bacterium]|nr:hypothetical protein [Longimicrobiales bacterium]
MINVPVVPPQPPSPRTRELADLLGRVIEEYEKHHPSVTGSEVRAALHMAGQSSKGAPPVAAVAVALGVAALLGGVFFFMAANGGEFSAEGIPMVGAVVVLLGIVGVALLLKRLAGK